MRFVAGPAPVQCPRTAGPRAEPLHFCREPRRKEPSIYGDPPTESKGLCCLIFSSPGRPSVTTIPSILGLLRCRSGVNGFSSSDGHFSRPDHSRYRFPPERVGCFHRLRGGQSDPTSHLGSNVRSNRDEMTYFVRNRQQDRDRDCHERESCHPASRRAGARPIRGWRPQHLNW